MTASLSPVLIAVLLALGHTVAIRLPAVNSNANSRQALAAEVEAEAVPNHDADDAGDQNGVLYKLQAVLFGKFADWDNADNATPDGDEFGDAHGPAIPEAGEVSEEQQFLFELQQVLAVAQKLLHAVGCPEGNGTKRGPDCPRPAPELLQGATSAFLSSILLQYPRGPTSPDDLAAWASTSLAFLEAHHRAQRQQRAAASAAAEAEENREEEDGGTEGVAGSQDYHEKKRRLRRLSAREASELSEARDTHVVGATSSGDTKRNSSNSSNRSNSRSSRSSSRSNSSTSSSRRRRRAKDSSASRSLPTHAVMDVGGLPLVRRVLIAQLLMSWLEPLQQELPYLQSAGEALSQLVTKLYEMHVESVVDRAALEYFHISKAGGTSWTAAAKANRCSVPHAKASRTPEFDDDCRWFVPSELTKLGMTKGEAASSLVCPRYGIVERRSVVRDCAKRLEHFRRVGLHYTSNEYTLHGGHSNMYDTHICPQFVNVVTIREPLGRLVSNLKYMLVQLKKDRHIRKGRFEPTFCNASKSDWERFAPPVVDNYNIRTLVGERAFHTKLYGIGEAHEALAKALLLQFDLVLDLNSGPTAADLVMRSGLGWNTTLAEIHIWTSELLAHRSGLNFDTCPLGDIQPFLERQKPDQRWYSFGRALSHLDELFLSMAVQLGLRPWPSDWKERNLGPPPDDGTTYTDCGLVGMVPLWLQPGA